MEKRKLNWITWGVVALTILVLFMMLMGSQRRSGEITLPDTSTAPGPAAGEGDALTVVEVTRSTVQAAIATLARPEIYRRTVTVEQFWGGGSGSYEIAVAVSGPWTRTDRTMPDGRVRHTITGDETVHIWYNNEETLYTAPVGEISADSEQSIPTYEDILDLPAGSIAAADYRTISGVNCIFVETAEDEAGYVLRYWVSVDTGLLAATEKLLAGETVYRMGALTVDQTENAPEDFTLPDGTVLVEPEEPA